MRDAYPQWYPPDEKSLQHAFKNGTVALDTNILHHLYRLGEQQRNQVLKVLENDDIKPRIWLPYQVGLEYQKNRLKNAYDQSRVYADLIEEVEKHGRQIRSKFEVNISDPEVRKEPIDTLETVVKQLSGQLEELGRKHVIGFDIASSENDPIRAALDRIFSSGASVGAKPDASVIGSRTAESRKRYERRVPPGYKDAEGPNKKPNPEGDYLIWCELLDHATSSGRPMVFVTNDEKEDWYQHGPDGKVLGPRPELREEMMARSADCYHQTTLTGFLRSVDRFLSIRVDEATIEQVDATIFAPVAEAPNPSFKYIDSVFDCLLEHFPNVEIMPGSHARNDGISFVLVSDGKVFAEVAVRPTRAALYPEELIELVQFSDSPSPGVIAVSNNLRGNKIARWRRSNCVAIAVEYTSDQTSGLRAAVEHFLEEGRKIKIKDYTI
ncbi:PIN-like domain-containing protein [Nocardia sp. NPDC002869]|uniref:PIN-like domain-containing protein n=1 Tax=Nocardia sp. NPDC002869 TaxID=3161032 RepID=UPI00398CC779